VAFTLDNSSVGGDVPAELAALRLPPTMDHTAIATAALAALSFSEALAVITAWHAKRGSVERHTVLATLHEAGD
jgi:hypothetical protein